MHQTASLFYVRDVGLKRIVVSLIAAALAALLAVGWLGAEPATAQTEGPTIEWWNPSAGTSTDIDNSTDADDTYHFVTTVSSVPTLPYVEYKLIHNTSGNEIELGAADRVGSSDTWELFHTLENVPTGAYTLRATLFTNFTGAGTGQSVDDDDIGVNVRDGWETVEIVYPENAGGLGYYVNPADGSARFTIDAVSSSGARFMHFYYTFSAPGSEPAWESCSWGEPESSFEGEIPEDSQFFRQQCTIAGSEEEPAQDQVASITGVAAVADSTPEPAPVPASESCAAPVCVTSEDTADAHRVFPYAQQPSSVTMDPQQVNQVNPGSCSPNITATVFDQNGRQIVGAKVDVHAQGPTDNLKFASNTGGSTGRSAHRAPEGGGHTRTETSWNCSSSAPTSGGQAEHDVTGPAPEGADVKHIQSAAAGTNKHGRFTFALRSPDGGTTQVTAWADARADDRHCAEEPAGHAAIGWGTDAPAATGLQHDPSAPCGGQPGDEEVADGPCAGFTKGTRTPRSEGDGEVIVGTDGDDELEGTSGDDVICGLDGDDNIKGKGGHDTIHGDAGDDEIRGGAGNDSIYGGPGDDEIYGHSGHDDIFGGGGADLIFGNKGNDTIKGHSANDMLRGGKGHDKVWGNRGSDGINGGRGNDTLRGGKGHDGINGNRGHDTLFSGRGRDVMNGGPGQDTCNEGPGSNTTRNCEG